MTEDNKLGGNKHPHHGVPKGKHRPRSREHSLGERIGLAQKSSLRQRPKVPVTLKTVPWSKP